MLEKFIYLLEYCKSDGFDQKIFSNLSKDYTGWYKKMNYSEQGLLTEDIHKHYKD